MSSGRRCPRLVCLDSACAGGDQDLAFGAQLVADPAEPDLPDVADAC
jgi:hypothetical protein